MSSLDKLVAKRDFGPDFVDALRQALPTPEERAKFVNGVIRGLVARDHHSVFWGDRMMTLDKSLGFMADPEFKATFDKVLSDYAYDQYGGRQTIAWRLHTLVWAAQRALRLPGGDFIECGVYRGDMAWTIANITRFTECDRRFVLYDSFEGIDPRQAKPEDYPINVGFLEFANKIYGEAGLYDRVKARFAEYDNVSVVRGYLPATLDDPATPEKIAFFHLDLNSPAAERACLERLFPKVVPGGVIVLDDYGWFGFKPQKDVADQFFKAHGQPVMELPTGQGLIVKI